MHTDNLIAGNNQVAATMNLNNAISEKNPAFCIIQSNSLIISKDMM